MRPADWAAIALAAIAALTCLSALVGLGRSFGKLEGRILTYMEMAGQDRDSIRRELTSVGTRLNVHVENRGRHRA